MKRMVSVMLAVVMVGMLAGVALAHEPGWGPMMGGRSPMMAGRSPMAGGPEACPMWGAAGTEAVTEAVTEDKARELANEYVTKYFKGFTIERVLPFTGRFRTMYQVELRGPKGETRYLHVTPRGDVRPFGPLAATTD